MTYIIVWLGKQKYNILFIPIDLPSQDLVSMCYSPTALGNVAKTDINEYIIQQMKRKIQPFFIRNHKKRRHLEGMAPNHLVSPPSCIHSLNRNSEATPTVQHEKGSRYNKIKSTINIQSERQRDSNINPTTPFQKYEILRSKVQRFVSKKKKKIQQKQFQATHNTCANTPNPITYNRGIVTTLSKPFDYGKIQFQMKKNLEMYENSSCQAKLNLEHHPVEKVEEKRHLKKMRRSGDKQNNSPIVKKSGTRSKIQLHSSRNRKSSFALRDFKELEDDKEDKIDLQFEEGLVEQIYTTTRIKFRKKINQHKSRKNIYDGALYFLKD